MVCFFTSYLKQTADSIASRLRLGCKIFKENHDNQWCEQTLLGWCSIFILLASRTSFLSSSISWLLGGAQINIQNKHGLMATCNNSKNKLYTGHKSKEHSLWWCSTSFSLLLEAESCTCNAFSTFSIAALAFSISASARALSSSATLRASSVA